MQSGQLKITLRQGALSGDWFVKLPSPYLLFGKTEIGNVKKRENFNVKFPEITHKNEIVWQTNNN